MAPPSTTTDNESAALESNGRRLADVFAVGPWHEREFVVVRRLVDPHNAWTVFPSAETVLSQVVARNPPPELLFLAQPRPGYYPRDTTERLLRAAPLTRPIIVAGTSCEGELRTGVPLSGGVRLYWYELPAWWRKSTAQIASGASPMWSQPLDDVHAGRWNWQEAKVRCVDENAAAEPVHIAVDAADRSAFEAINDALAPEGFQCGWRPRGGGIAATQELSTGGPHGGVWDGGQLDPDGFARLREFAIELSRVTAPVIALVDFPRVEHYDQIRAAGAASLLGKPYLVSALAGELRNAIAGAGGSPNYLRSAALSSKAN